MCECVCENQKNLFSLQCFLITLITFIPTINENVGQRMCRIRMKTTVPFLIWLQLSLYSRAFITGIRKTRAHRSLLNYEDPSNSNENSFIETNQQKSKRRGTFGLSPRVKKSRSQMETAQNFSERSLLKPSSYYRKPQNFTVTAAEQTTQNLIKRSLLKPSPYYRKPQNLTLKRRNNRNFTPVIFPRPPKKGTRKAERIVTNAEELQKAVLDDGYLLEELTFKNCSFIPTPRNASAEYIGKFDPFNHEVIKLMKMRVNTNSKPGFRAENDTSVLALSIEGGGMRGATGAGMAAAIAVLGLSDVFDKVYGSSAGSVVGAYFVSRQMHIDIYTEVLTAAKEKFVSKGRLASSLATNLFDTRVLNSTLFSKYVQPAMNISYVLDSIMCPTKGLRPLDLEAFKQNDELQQLRVVASTVRDGKMETHCFGSKNMDFFDKKNENGEIVENATTMVGSDRHGLFACMETSMLVPAATRAPLPLLRNKDYHLNITTRSFDAFAYEPIPYRSAVEEGATHCLVLKTRPDGSAIGTKQGLFENVFAPMYFDSNNMPEVSKYFQNGGQQYIYVEDYLTLDSGKRHVVDDKCWSLKGVPVPPRKILYGVELDNDTKYLRENRQSWKRAHLLPLSVPEGKPELSTLSVDQDEVLEAVRLGFAAAFDLLSPVANITFPLQKHLDGYRVAELLFSHVGSSTNVLESPILVSGDFIYEGEETRRKQISNGFATNMEKAVQRDLKQAYFMKKMESLRKGEDLCPRRDASQLLDLLPGFDRGRMQSLSTGLHLLKDTDSINR